MRTSPLIVLNTAALLMTGAALAASTPETLNLDEPWSCTAGDPISVEDASEGLGSMLMQIPGYSTCESAEFYCDELTTSDEILIDVKLPTELPNPHWVGDIGLLADVPSANLHNSWVGMAILTGLPTDEWVTVSIPATENLLTAFSGGCSDARIKIALNTSAPNVQIDNIRFRSDTSSMLMSISEDADDGQFDPSLSAIPSGWSTVGERSGKLYSGSYQISAWGGTWKRPHHNSFQIRTQ